MSNETRPDLDFSEVPASCPFVIIDPAGEIAGWSETEDGAVRTCAEWGAIDGATYTWIELELVDEHEAA